MKKSKRIPLPLEEIKALYKEGHTLNSLAKKYGVSRKTIADRLREANIAIVPAHSYRVRSFDMEAVKSLYDSGESLRAIAKRFNTDHKTIGRKLENIGVKLRERKFDIDKSILTDLHHEQGLSLNRIASRYNVAPITISRRFKKLGIPIRIEKYDLPLNLLKKKYEGGKSIAEIAREYEVPFDSIKTRLLKLGVKLRSMESDLPPIEVLKAEYEAGETTVSLGKKYGVHYNTINKRFKKYGILLRESGKKRRHESNKSD